MLLQYVFVQQQVAQHIRVAVVALAPVAVLLQRVYAQVAEYRQVVVVLFLVEQEQLLAAEHTQVAAVLAVYRFFPAAD